MTRAVFPASFDPVHNGHINIIGRASKLFDEIYIAVYDKPLKNLLFSPEERISLVQYTFRDNPKTKIIGYSGLTIDLCKKMNIDVVIRGLRVVSDFEYEFRMAHTNKLLYEELETIALITDPQLTFLSSSTVREIAALHGDVSKMVPPHVNKALIKKFENIE
jgi:pantetheine-phosphate adenylyltransferase